MYERYAHLVEDEDAPREHRTRLRRAEDEPAPRNRGRLTEEERDLLALRRADAVSEAGPLPPTGDRWSTWDEGERGPTPYPEWLVTDLGAVDIELGVLKSGKEADVHLLERTLPDGGRSCLLAAKRYRGSDHRLFHRDAGYLEGRRMRKSREARAIAGRTGFGRNLIAEQWAVAEFTALSRLWQVGAPVPFPVQRVGTEVLLEFVGSPDGTAAPRLAQLRPSAAEARELWRQALDAMTVLARHGYAHGDLSPYNVLVHDGQLVLIDLPQVVDVVANPRGPEFLARDVANLCRWFAGHGVPATDCDPVACVGRLRAELGLN
ncbi:serine protein kinase RIO [Longimycelium tulufanense]|uniref:serine protein kinase RIO n=1 Tax=Longimycelium tulufanense TaxID=907463 RepID=UPI001662DBB6